MDSFTPPIVSLIEKEEESKCWLVEEISKRSVALIIISVYSECLLGEVMEVKEAYEFVSGIIDRFGVEIIEEPKLRPWGTKNMSFYDPDHNVIYFRSFNK